MRRVYDDTRFLDVRDYVMFNLQTMGKADINDVVRYSWGTDRVMVSLVKEKIKGWLGDDFKFGKNEHAHGIGNNNAIEVIYVGEDEEQICALLHLTDDMYGGVWCRVTDIDGKRSNYSVHISKHGTKVD